ncbi:MAG TPA: hypothetical protein VF173_02285 [Thermoanaerobaculia bacterium]|nr:hypothetical protein [Thermoanaerobaculia bacterium]
MRDTNGTSKVFQRCNRNLVLEIGALFLALLGLICLVMGVYDVLVSIVQIPGVTLSPILRIAVISFDFVSAILIGIVCLVLRAIAR